jgi:hypothetical protein
VKYVVLENYKVPDTHCYIRLGSVIEVSTKDEDRLASYDFTAAIKNVDILGPGQSPQNSIVRGINKSIVWGINRDCKMIKLDDYNELAKLLYE